MYSINYLKNKSYTNILMLLDNPMISDNRVEKEIESLYKHLRVRIKVLALKEDNLIVLLTYLRLNQNDY